MNEWVDAAVLWVHLFSAVLFVGGSFFMWLVLEPVSHRITTDEAARTLLVGRVARRFGKLTTPLLVVLIVTGLYNATWYLPPGTGVFTTLPGELLLAKAVSTAALVTGIYVHNAYFGRKIVRLAREGKVDELRQLRKKSRVVSAMNLLLMVVVLLVAVLMQLPP